MVDREKNTALNTFKPWKILLAVGFGLSVSGYQLYKGLKGKSIEVLFQELASPNWNWLVLAVVVLLIRDLGYIYRIKSLTNHELSWRSSFFVIILWEFASAITPSVVGGTAVAVFLLNKEKIKMGKSVAYVTLTAILDNLFFILAGPIAMLLIHDSAFFSMTRSFLGWFDFKLSYIFFMSYLTIASYTLFMAFGVLINPKLFQKIVVGIAGIFGFSTKYKQKAFRLTFDNITAAQELKSLGFGYWFRAIASTIFVWMARYFMLNCLLAAYFTMTLDDHQIALGKQLVLWVTQLLSPTPGASGFAETFMVELFGGALIIKSITVLWRFFTYYAYLIAGSIVLPRWLLSTKD